VWVVCLVCTRLHLGNRIRPQTTSRGWINVTGLSRPQLSSGLPMQRRRAPKNVKHRSPECRQCLFRRIFRRLLPLNGSAQITATRPNTIRSLLIVGYPSRKAALKSVGNGVRSFSSQWRADISTPRSAPPGIFAILNSPRKSASRFSWAKHLPNGTRRIEYASRRLNKL
jgi:hypothetical protein